MLVSGADDVVKDIKQQSDELGKRYGSIFVEAPRASRRRSFYNFFLRHQDAVDDSLTSPSVHRKTAMNNNTTNTTSTSASTSGTTSSTASAPLGATGCGPAATSASASDSDRHQAVGGGSAVIPSRKRASSFIRKKPPLERGLSAQSALRVNKNAFVCMCELYLVSPLEQLTKVLLFCRLPAEAPAPEVIVTRPSPDQQTHPHSLSLRPDNATLVHVLVHRESEEYKEEDESSSPSSPGNGNGISCGLDRLAKQAPPQIRISTGSVESSTMDTCAMPTVQIMVDSPKDPPRGDFSTEFAAHTAEVMEDVDAPIDVNVQGDTSQVFYDYNPNRDEAEEEEEKETLDEALPDRQR
ncbi:hypothetical protein KR084_006883 [Drosophila pseudotakahashii]|nr:hypothetical protein KR084_006883 [Drosophila pseudotakahashii]